MSKIICEDYPNATLYDKELLKRLATRLGNKPIPRCKELENFCEGWARLAIMTFPPKSLSDLLVQYVGVLTWGFYLGTQYQKEIQDKMTINLQLQAETP